jgi:hypothetical protein
VLVLLAGMGLALAPLGGAAASARPASRGTESLGWLASSHRRICTQVLGDSKKVAQQLEKVTAQFVTGGPAPSLAAEKAGFASVYADEVKVTSVLIGGLHSVPSKVETAIREEGKVASSDLRKIEGDTAAAQVQATLPAPSAKTTKVVSSYLRTLCGSSSTPTS